MTLAALALALWAIAWGQDAGAVLRRAVQDFQAARTLSATATTNALIRTTCITTLFDAGTAPNAIPASAAANVNCRVIPGERQDQIIEAIRGAIADPSV